MARSIREVMTAQPKVLASSATLADAARAMRGADIGDVLVEEDGKTIGIVTDRDIVVRGVAAGKDPHATSLREVCSGQLTSAGPDDSVEDVMRLMKQHAIRRVPVLEDGVAIEIVSLGDLATLRDEKSVLGQVSAAPPNK